MKIMYIYTDRKMIDFLPFKDMGTNNIKYHSHAAWSMNSVLLLMQGEREYHWEFPLEYIMSNATYVNRDVMMLISV